MSSCHGCGGPLPPNAKKWCTEVCRGRARRGSIPVALDATADAGTGHVAALEETLAALELGQDASALVAYARSLAAQLDRGAGASVGREYRLAVTVILDLDPPDETAEEVEERAAFLKVLSTPVYTTA